MDANCCKTQGIWKWRKIHGDRKCHKGYRNSKMLVFKTSKNSGTAMDDVTLFFARPCWATWPLQPWALMCTAAADPCRKRSQKMRQEALGHCPKAQYGHLPLPLGCWIQWTLNIGLLCWKWLPGPLPWKIAIHPMFIDMTRLAKTCHNVYLYSCCLPPFLYVGCSLLSLLGLVAWVTSQSN